ncbi:MAG: sigma-70 family RNA polymerase sigma factor [Bacteroidota bacterium]
MVSLATKTAFLNWYQPYHQRLLRYCASRAFGVMDAEDLMQEAILATLANWDKINDHSKLLSYMMGVVNNLVRNHRRRKKFTGQLEEERLAQLESKLGDTEKALEVNALLEAIAQLPDEQAEALELFTISGFSVKETAVIQGVSEGAVKTRVSRARKTLRQMLEDDLQHMTIMQRLQVYTSILL